MRNRRTSRRFPLRIRASLATLSLVLAGVAGCRDNTPPPPRVPVPSARGDQQAMREYERPRPIQITPMDESNAGRYDDQPLLVQPVPEQRAFIDAYQRIGRPKITLFVNRTMEGNL